MWRRLGSSALLGLFISMASLAPARADTVELAGVKYETVEQVGNAKLQLNGAGIRYKAIFKVYTAGLYLPAKMGTPEAVYGAVNAPRRIHIVMLREIDGNELGKLFTQGMEKNSPREIFAKSINGTIKMADLFSKRKKLSAGESFSVDWVPGTGTVISVNGKPESEPIKEPEFYTALMSIWLGPSPADSQLKDALLGKARSGRFGSDQ
ncbi:chalcone isomerase family protein [Ideonella sp.]|uniref:chalcone isomerase family protein n=1 Tax=Ideonella sp. TaxID=1929293 RepID=UPI002B471EC2|nr:chalcone isomerase family protein [Ideonella sp.]HJV68941.1 chalcone isomerase family protein [Ideonella sp.]